MSCWSCALVCELCLVHSCQVLRQLQQGLAKCYSVAFEKSGAVSDAKITPHTLNFVKKLVSTFGVGLENVSNVSTMFSSAASESLARRAQATAQDPVFQKLKGQFTTGESASVPPAPGRGPAHFLGLSLWQLERNQYGAAHKATLKRTSTV